MPPLARFQDWRASFTGPLRNHSLILMCRSVSFMSEASPVLLSLFQQNRIMLSFQFSRQPTKRTQQHLLTHLCTPFCAACTTTFMYSRYGVDLYFSGHEHVYGHYFPIYQGKQCCGLNETTIEAAPTSPVQQSCGLPPGSDHTQLCPCTAHIVVGNAGNREFPYHNGDGSVEAFLFPQPSYEMFRSISPAGFGLSTVHNGSAMSWTQLNSRTGDVIDAHIYNR